MVDRRNCRRQYTHYPAEYRWQPHVPALSVAQTSSRPGLGAALFVGNIIVTAVWMVLAEQSQNKSTLHFASKVVTWADVFFTAPGILLTLANGQIMATVAWGGMRESWVALAFGLFVLSGIVWVAFLLRFQNRLIQLSTGPAISQELMPKSFFQILHYWYVAGGVATLLPLISMVLMVVKPNLW